MHPTLENELAALFREAGKAHHEAYEAVSGNDPEWPAWYAEYLAPRLRELTGETCSVPELAAELQEMDAAYRTSKNQEPWPLAYARSFLDKRRG